MNEEMINNFTEVIEIIKKEFNYKAMIGIGFNIRKGKVKDICQKFNKEDSVCIIYQTINNNTKEWFIKKDKIRIINGYLVILTDLIFYIFINRLEDKLIMNFIL